MFVDAAGLRAYIGAVLSETEAGGVMEMPVFGSSMAPFLIHGRDAVRLVKCTHPPKRGEIVLFRRPDGQFVLHRVWRAAKSWYYLLGDAQTEPEGPVHAGQICCLVIAVRRKGKWYDPQSALWRFFKTFWLVLMPARPLLIHILAHRHARKIEVRHES